MPKLTTVQRQEVRQWIKLCRIRGLSLQETREFVNKQLPDGYSLSRPAIEKYIATVKIESKNWMEKMAFDVYEFIHELKERLDEMHELKRHGWEMLDDAKKQGDIGSQIKAVIMLCKVNNELLQMELLLPQLVIPNSRLSLPSLSTTNIKQQLDWKNDPTFVGMPGHNLDNNYQPRFDPNDQP